MSSPTRLVGAFRWHPRAKKNTERFLRDSAKSLVASLVMKLTLCVCVTRQCNTKKRAKLIGFAPLFGVSDDYLEGARVT